MGFPRIANSFLSPTVFSASTEAAGFEKERLILKDKPNRTTRTTVTTDSNYIIDLGSNQTAITIQIENTNYTQYKFQESSDNTTAPPSWDDLHTTQTINKTDGHSMRRAVIDLTLTTKRYIRLFIPSQAPVDGATYLETGTLAITDSLVTLPMGLTQQDMQYEVNDTNITNEFADRGVEVLSRGQHKPLVLTMGYQVTINQNFEGTDYSQWFDLTGDTSTLILIDLNLGNNSQSFIGRFTGSIRSGYGSNSGFAKYTGRAFRVAH